MFVWCNDSNEYQALLVIPTRHIILRTLNASMFPASKLWTEIDHVAPHEHPTFTALNQTRMVIIQQTQSSNLGPDRASFFSMSAGNHGL